MLPTKSHIKRAFADSQVGRYKRGGALENRLGNLAGILVETYPLCNTTNGLFASSHR